ncbi:hypothetical protein Tco_1491885 [Tanacetum coccineum]
MSSMELGVVLDLGCSLWLEKFDFICILYREDDDLELLIHQSLKSIGCGLYFVMPIWKSRLVAILSLLSVHLWTEIRDFTLILCTLTIFWCNTIYRGNPLPKKEKDDLKLKLEKIEESSKNLTKLINSQISAKDKAGLGYDSQMNESEVVHSMFNSRESDVDDSPVNDRFKTGKFHVVPPPYTGNYMPSRPDLSFAGLDDSVYKTKDTDSDNDSVFRPKSDQTKTKYTKINFVKSDENVKSVNKENTHRQVEYLRKSQSHRDNKRNWNGMMTQKLGNAVATKSRQVPVNAAKQSSPRVVASISTARPVNTAAPKPTVNDALPITYSYFKAHSPGNPQYTIQDQGIFDSGCSRHMTGNKSFLTNYQEINGGFVAFGGSPKGGKIKTGKLDFKDVYFVKELKFNLFSVSQMCDKKNSVLFTKTECLVLSPDFKLLDESQVLLKVPRHDNMYSFDLKNVVPSGEVPIIRKFKESSKNLTKLINSQISAKDKTGLGYDSQMNKSEVVHSVFNSRESDVDDSPVNDRFKIGEGFHVVPPPYTRNYMPSRPDLSFAGLDDSVYKTKVSETETSISKTSKDIVEKPKTVRPSAPIIEEWDTNSDNDSVFRPKSDQTKPKFTKINFVKSGENVKSVNKENTHRQVEYPRKSQSPRDNRRNWNGMMTQKLGNGFESIKKACFVCGSLNHLIKDCDFHENKMVEKPMLNNKGRVTGQREIRPVWNNAQRVNHQNKLTHPHPKRNFVPTAVATKLGQVPVNAAKQSSPRAATSISTARPVNTAAPKPKVNDALPTTYSYFKAHSPVRRAFNQKSAAKTNNFNEKVNTTRVNKVTTAGPKAVVSATVGNGENVVKSSACWIWRPTGNVIDHTSKDSGSYMLKRFDYVDLQGRLNECSRNMTGNKSFLTDYQEIDGGFVAFVAFGGSPKGGKITRKEISALFTETECLVLSPDFKLLDESQVLLKVPRHDNMYSFDLKNVVPLGVLTCLFAKAIIDESN